MQTQNSIADSGVIRSAAAEDCAVVEEIVRAAYAVYIPRIGIPPGPMLDDYKARIAAGSVSVIADDDCVVAGLVVLLPQADHLLLDNIAVAPARQGRGFGRRLIAFAEDEARRLGYREIRLYTHQMMIENIALYTRLGFEITGRGQQSGYDRVFMRKAVAA